MTRLSTGAFAVLVAATIAAFFLTQHLKVTTPLIQGAPRPVPGVIDPLHGVPCVQGRNSGSTTISFYLQHRADTVDVFVVSDATGAIVRTVASGRHMRKDVRNPDGVFHWNGREDDGQAAPEGTYYFRVALIHQNRTIDLSGNPINVKSSPPHPVVTRVTPSLIPGANGTHVTIHYAGNEGRGGTVRIYRTDLPGGPRLVKSFLTPWNGHTTIWDGKISQRPAPAGTYLIGLDVTDAACDTGRFPAHIPPAPGTAPNTGVTVSYLAAQAPLDPVRAGSDAEVHVRSRGLAYHWALEGERARARRSRRASPTRRRCPCPCRADARGCTSSRCGHRPARPRSRSSPAAPLVRVCWSCSRPLAGKDSIPSMTPATAFPIRSPTVARSISIARLSIPLPRGSPTRPACSLTSTRPIARMS